MLLAYSLSATGTLTADTVAALKAAEKHLAMVTLKGAFAGLSLRWDEVTPGDVDGSFVRGYAQTTTRDRAVLMVEALRRLSREFPGITVYVSGWGDLPPTTVRAGTFALFAEAYERAIAQAMRLETHYRCS